MIRQRLVQIFFKPISDPATFPGKLCDRREIAGPETCKTCTMDECSIVKAREARRQ